MNTRNCFPEKIINSHKNSILSNIYIYVNGNKEDAENVKSVKKVY